MPEINALREENVEPGFGRARLWFGRVGLDFDIARIDMNVVELPAPDEYSPWIKPGRDATRIDRAERLAAVISLKAVRCGGEKILSMDRRLISRWVMQPLCRFFFPFGTKFITLPVVCLPRIESRDFNRAKDQ